MDYPKKNNFLKIPGSYNVTVTQVIPKMSKQNFPQLQVEFRTDGGDLISTWLTQKMIDKKSGGVVENKRAMEKLAKLKMVCGLGPTAKAGDLVGKRLNITAQVEFLGVSDFSPAGAETGNAAFDDFSTGSTTPAAHSVEEIPW